METNISANPLETGADELERFALEECVKRKRIDHSVLAMVMPAGHCDLALKLARVGARVVAGDSLKFRKSIEGRVLAAGLSDEVVFAGYELPGLPDSPDGDSFDLIVVRRGLCSMPYEEARSVLRQLLLKLKIGGKLYISVLGLHSELGTGYADAERPVNERFATLDPVLARKYDIPMPVCLYTERNLFMLLLESGASVLRTLTTTYGNVKGIAVRV